VLTLLARRVAGLGVPVVYDVHGDWRNDTRVYGSPLRRVLNPLTDRLATLAVRNADGVRTVSGFTTGLVRELGVEPTATFPAYMDLEPFTSRPPARLPDPAGVLFVGVLERYKAVDVLAAAWPHVAKALPDARLHLVGKGLLEPIVADLTRAGGGRVRWTRELPTGEIARALDEASVLVLPSRREGMGRVIVEAFCRGRSVVGTASGGIVDLVQDGLSGLLVPVDDPDALAHALVRVLGDPELAARLGAGAYAASSDWAATPEEFARRVRDLVDRVLAGRT
jgi:glycosyltransferase involved in cell wall biosynthesis